MPFGSASHAAGFFNFLEVTMNTLLNSVDKVEVLTLQDNYIDLVAQDSNEVVQRAMLKGNEFRRSIRAEHGFSTYRRHENGKARHMLFDFGFSKMVPP